MSAAAFGWRQLRAPVIPVFSGLCMQLFALAVSPDVAVQGSLLSPELGVCLLLRGVAVEVLQQRVSLGVAEKGDGTVVLLSGFMAGFRAPPQAPAGACMRAPSS